MQQTDWQLFNAIGYNGTLDHADIIGWIKEAYPKAVTYIPVEMNSRADLLCDYELKRRDELPLGGWMGCYPSLVNGRAQLTVLNDWSLFLYALYLSVQEYVRDQAMLQAAFLDKSRMKIGIMNDVYQPFAPLPDPYSMIRHHSFILYLSFWWLTPEEKHRWITICEQTGRQQAISLSKTVNPLAWIASIEMEAAAIMKSASHLSVTAEEAAELFSIHPYIAPLKDYFALTCFGIDVVAKEHEKHGLSDKWLLEQSNRPISAPDYLEQAILEYIDQYGEKWEEEAK